MHEWKRITLTLLHDGGGYYHTWKCKKCNLVIKRYIHPLNQVGPPPSNVSIQVRCTAADRCGVTNCPHAVAHDWLGALACGYYPCETYMRQAGIGRKRAECECVPVEDEAE